MLGREELEVMKEEELKVEEIEVSLTLGGVGEVVRGEGRGEVVDTTLMSYTLKYISLANVTYLLSDTWGLFGKVV